MNNLLQKNELHKELRLANKKILDQQKSVLEEERLRLLFKMIGVAAHELGQPLMALLGIISLMRIKKDDPEKLFQYVDRIEKAGQKIAETLKKIQTIRNEEANTYLKEFSIINLDQEIKILTIEDSNKDFETINKILNDYELIDLSRTTNIEGAMKILEKGQFDLILANFLLGDGNGFDFFKRMEKAGFDVPVVVITENGDELTTSRLIQAGAYDYLCRTSISNESVSRAISSSLQKFHLKKEIKLTMEKLD